MKSTTISLLTLIFLSCIVFASENEPVQDLDDGGPNIVQRLEIMKQEMQRKAEEAKKEDFEKLYNNDRFSPLKQKDKDDIQNNAIVSEIDQESDEDDFTPKRLAWLLSDQSLTLRIVLGLVMLLLICLALIKIYRIRKSISKKTKQMENYASTMEKIIEGADRLVFVTWKDQKEGILFMDNPCYKKKAQVDLSKAQFIQAEIDKLEADIVKKNREIGALQSKESYYAEEIERLKEELGDSKRKILDEGAALGFTEPVLKEFK